MERMRTLMRSLAAFTERAGVPFISLRAKLVLFTSMVIVAVTFAVSAYFFQREAATMTRSLTDAIERATCVP